MEINGYISTEIGARSYQQDACRWTKEGDLVIGIICDGMGGMEEGDLASNYAVNYFMENIPQISKGSQIDESLREIVKKIDADVYRMEEKTGTTLVAAIIYDHNMHWISVGDSKMYIIRGQEMVCPVKEHIYLNLLNKQLDQKLISEEEYEERLGMKDALISYVGMGNVSLMDTNPAPFHLRDGDQILICSDGLYKAVGELSIKRIIIDYKNEPETILEYLQYLAKEQGKSRQDNTSMILLQCKGE